MLIMVSDINADTWSATANAYTGQITVATGKACEALLDLAGSHHPIKKDSVILDTGTGTGELTTRILARCAEASITATDIAPGMLQVLRARDLPITVQKLDATKDYIAQGLHEGSFTHVLSTFMHQFITPVQSAVKETFRVLQPGGLIGVGIWTQNQSIDPWSIACKNLDPAFEPAKPPPGLFEWRSTEHMEIAFAAAGFVDLRSETLELSLDFDSAEHYVDWFLTAKNPAWMMAQSAWKGDLADVRDEAVKVVREQFRDGKIPCEAGLTVGRKPGRLVA